MCRQISVFLVSRKCRRDKSVAAPRLTFHDASAQETLPMEVNKTLIERRRCDRYLARGVSPGVEEIKQ